MSLGICFIQGGKAHLVSDRKVTLLNNKDGGNTLCTREKIKVFKLGNVCYSVLGLEPLTDWVKGEIDTLDSFDVEKIKNICELMELRFWDSLDDNLKNVEWLENGNVALLSVLWASDKPEIGVISSDDGYIPKRYCEEGKLLGKAAVKADAMLSIILKHFRAGHPSIESILSHIFQEANSLDSAISKEFDLVCILPQKIISLTANKLTAGTIDAEVIDVTNLNADNITSGTITGREIRTASSGKCLEISLSDYSGYINFMDDNGNDKAWIYLNTSNDMVIRNGGDLSIRAADGNIDIQTLSSGQISLISQDDIYITPDSSSYCYIDGKLKHTGSQIGFFGVEPVTQQTAAKLADTATLSDVIIKTNGMLTKLGYYGLFEVS